MILLTPENKTFELDYIPQEVDDTYFCIFDCGTEREEIDYHFVPLIYLETFYSPAVVLNIGNYQLQLPLDWNMIVCDEEMLDIELMPITDLNDRAFHTPLINPLSPDAPRSEEVNIVNIYPQIKWHIPSLNIGTMLVLPLEEGDNPKCGIFVKDTSKMKLKELDLGHILG